VELAPPHGLAFEHPRQDADDADDRPGERTNRHCAEQSLDNVRRCCGKSQGAEKLVERENTEQKSCWAAKRVDELVIPLNFGSLREPAADSHRDKRDRASDEDGYGDREEDTEPLPRSEPPRACTKRRRYAGLDESRSVLLVEAGDTGHRRCRDDPGAFGQEMSEDDGHVGSLGGNRGHALRLESIRGIAL
jgi:hypothetical protein